MRVCPEVASYRRNVILLISIIHILNLVGTAPTTVADDAAQRPRRIIYNSDADNMFLYVAPPMKPADVHRYVDELVGTGVTTLYMCPNYGMVTNYSSEVGEVVGANATAEENEKIEQVAKNHSASLERAVVNIRGLIKEGHDPLELILDRAREHKLETFITFRLNECHCVDTPEQYPLNLIISQRWRSHPDWWIGKPGSKLGALHQEILGPNTSPVVGTWLPGGFNFALQQVRDFRLAELRECCERYNIDGLDLDFQRFPMYFPVGEEASHVATMTAWVKSVRQMTHEVGQKRGRPILLSARTMARPEQNPGLGLDPISWARDGLIDFVIQSHYLRNDFPLPVGEYRAVLPAKMPLYGSIEVTDADSCRRLAQQLWKDGADGLMLFNYFTVRELGREPDFKLINELSDPKLLETAQ
jgi:hypothetical protein